jgi:ribose transport system permease protein
MTKEGSGKWDLARLLRDAPPWTGVGIVLVAMFVGLALTQDLFFTYTNLNNILRGMAIPLLMAIGSTFLLTTGMIDLSIGSMLALGTMILVGLLSLGIPGWLAVVGTMVACALLGGGLNGVLIA